MNKNGFYEIIGGAEAKFNQFIYRVNVTLLF